MQKIVNCVQNPYQYIRYRKKSISLLTMIFESYAAIGSVLEKIEDA